MLHASGNQGQSLRRHTGVKAFVVMLVLLAACSGPVDDVSPRVTEQVSTTVSQPATPLSARIEMSATSIRSGAKVDAQVIVENNTGSALQVTGCLSLFAVALGNDTIEPMISWAS